MNLNKIVGLVALLLAVVVAFVPTLPYAALILTVLGLYIGWGIDGADHVRVLVTAVVLSGAAGMTGVFGNIPAVGDYLTAIFAAIGTLAAAASMTIIGKNVWNRFKP